MTTNRVRPDAGWSVGSTKLAACRYCAGPVPKGRRSFCGGARGRHGSKFDAVSGEWRRVYTAGHGCVHEWCIRTSPGYVRDCVGQRDKGVCALCGIQCGYEHPGPPWQADHTVPVVEGGGECGLDGYRTLCEPCHKRETAALARRRALARRTQLPLRLEVA